MTDCHIDSQQATSHEPSHEHNPANDHDHDVHHDKKHPQHHEPEPDDDDGGIVQPLNESEPGNLPDPPPGH